VAKRTAPIRIISLVLLTACLALCQKPPPVGWCQGLQFDGSSSPEAQHQELRGAESLPDAPSTVQPPIQVARSSKFVNAAGSCSTRGARLISPMHETRLGHFTASPQRKLTAVYQAAPMHSETSAFLGKYLYATLQTQDEHYYASTSESFIGRASYAASRMLVTHDDSGKVRLNTRYLLGVLSSVAMHAAYHPYRARSTSGTFNNFGSTIGGDAGINVFHEFRPGIQQVVKGLTPKFVSRIEERITHDPIPK
jgi:hypothetical protein